MTSKFLNIDEEKQQRILNAALNEFAQKGYDHASTNAIVKLAGISKGLLFHYFNNKKELYLFLHKHFIDVLQNEFFNEERFAEPDVFERLKNIMILKSQMMKKYPEIFNFFISAYTETSSDIKNELDDSHHELMQSSYAKIFENIDTTMFKENIDMKRAIQIVFWTLEGYSNQVMEKVKHTNQSDNDFSAEFAEVDLYIQMLKTAFYQ
ncbi:TetR/AcrR family transcriptional regulator [Mesobacillus maritimus]|uniref:TetR/AcrR family transcriptional regulator n=1 Tax=Mesobacillus maritimus TaxID=1643336 RepID=A0ABS7K058_9BACI|nr:TetR/AcrR family transcriptional regulator [Mesobacillus maritimus]MBY0095635.1 TetR/AcrR family transcriptional regulator [Mesobacillus maritimus]